MSEDKLLIVYARAMRAVQAFEIQLNACLSLQMIWGGILRKSRFFKNDEIKKLLKGGKTLHEALRGLHQEFSKRNISAFSNEANEVLKQLAAYRNFLAHNYFPSRHLLIRDASMHSALIAELAWYAETFEQAQSLFGRMADFTITKLTEALGAKESDEKERLREQRLANTRSEQLEELKRALEQMGIEMPPIPSSYPKPS